MEGVCETHIITNYKYIFCRSISPAEAVKVSAGLFNVDFYEILQKPTISCKKYAYSRKPIISQYFSHSSDFFLHSKFDLCWLFPIPYVARGALITIDDYQGNSCNTRNKHKHHCRGPPLKRFQQVKILEVEDC